MNKEGKKDHNTFEVKCIMFRDTRKKRLRNRVIFAAIGVFMLSFGIWLNYQDNAAKKSEDAVKKVEVNSTEGTLEEEKERREGEVNSSSQGTDTKTEPETYLIKEVEGVVKVFLCDDEGNKELYLITSIPFDLLSEADQQLFVEGVTIKTEEDLGDFLQNFDS